MILTVIFGTDGADVVAAIEDIDAVLTYMEVRIDGKPVIRAPFHWHETGYHTICRGRTDRRNPTVRTAERLTTMPRKQAIEENYSWFILRVLDLLEDDGLDVAMTAERKGLFVTTDGGHQYKVSIESLLDPDPEPEPIRGFYPRRT